MPNAVLPTASSHKTRDGTSAPSPSSWLSMIERRTRPPPLHPPVWASPNISIATFSVPSNEEPGVSRAWPLHLEDHGRANVIVARQPPQPAVPTSSPPPTVEDEMQFTLTDDEEFEIIP